MYQERSAAPDLQPWVECYWFRRGFAVPRAPVRARILPDGCMDFIFNLGDPFPAGRPGASTPYPAFTMGAMRGATIVELAGRIDMVGIRFRPGGVLPFLDIPANRLTDEAVALNCCHAPRHVAATLEQLAETSDAASRVRVLDDLLRSVRRPRLPSPGVLRALALIRSTQGRVRVTELAVEAGMSPRHLQRGFAAIVGLTPATALRVARFRRLTALLGRPRSGNLARLAHECGYFDQPHMIRDFQDLAGLTPTAWLRERSRDVASVQDGPVLPG